MPQFALLALLIALQVSTIENSAVRNVPIRGDPNQIVCVRTMPTGTRVRPTRVCRTRAEWADLRDENYRLLNEKTAQLPFPKD